MSIDLCCKLDSTLCIETSKELRTRLAEVVYVEYADQSLTKQLVTCSMNTAYPPIRNNLCIAVVFYSFFQSPFSRLRLLQCPVVLSRGSVRLA
jgi:hypothetical protein